MANSYLGSKKVEESSSTNHEVIPNSPENWTRGFELYKFSFINSQDCTVIINDETEIFLLAEQGFNVERGDKKITSFKIKESGIKYVWVGAY